MATSRAAAAARAASGAGGGAGRHLAQSPTGVESFCSCLLLPLQTSKLSGAKACGCHCLGTSNSWANCGSVPPAQAGSFSASGAAAHPDARSTYLGERDFYWWTSNRRILRRQRPKSQPCHWQLCPEWWQCRPCRPVPRRRLLHCPWQQRPQCPRQWLLHCGGQRRSAKPW